MNRSTLFESNAYEVPELNSDPILTAISKAFIEREKPGAECHTMLEASRQKLYDDVRRHWFACCGIAKPTCFPFSMDFVMWLYMGHRKLSDYQKKERYQALGVRA